MPGHEDRIVWTIEQAKEAVKAFLATLERDGFGVIFGDPNVDPSDLTAFRNDDSRRQDGQSAAAQDWWASVREVATHNSARFLTLAEPLAQNGIALEELYAAIPTKYHADALTQALVCCRGLSQGGLPLGITATKGWTDDQVREKLEEVRGRLDWENTTGSAREWWVAFENENARRLASVLRLVEELAIRKATITEFYLAFVYSGTDNIPANMYYLDYTRLKKEEERRKKEAARNVAEPSLTGKTAASDFSSLPSDLGLPLGITATKGWTDDQVREKLEEVRGRLDWENTTGSAREWWVAFENENARRLALVLRLAEELAVRKATITEFVLASVYSNTDNIQAKLWYLDYTRLMQEENRRKKKDAETKRLESVLSDLRAGRPLPELSQDDVFILRHAVLDGVEPEVRDSLTEAISLAEVRLAEEAKRRRESEVAPSHDLAFTRCPACRSLVPAAFSQCRFCGHEWREADGEG
jgi:hypothetical protein